MDLRPAGWRPSVLTRWAVLLARTLLWCKAAGSWRAWDKYPLSQRVEGRSLIRLLSLQDPQSTRVITEGHISLISCRIMLIDFQNIWKGDRNPNVFSRYDNFKVFVSVFLSTLCNPIIFHPSLSFSFNSSFLNGSLCEVLIHSIPLLFRRFMLLSLQKNPIFQTGT